MEQVQECKVIPLFKDRRKQMFMTPKEFSQEYGIGWNKTYQLVHRKNFPKIMNGNRILIIRSQVEQYFLDNIGLEF
jgi:excisionase family DNA binding protein